MTLTIYSNNFDNYTYVVGRGMSGKVFLENGKTGREFKSAEAAIDFIAKTGVVLDEIVYNFQVNGKQMFKRLKIDNAVQAQHSSLSAASLSAEA